MSKKIVLDLSESEYNSLDKLWQQLKNSPIIPSSAKNVDEFCKDLLISFTKGPDLNSLKDMNLDELMKQLNNLAQFSGLFGNKKTELKKDNKKDEIPDDKKYKS